MVNKIEKFPAIGAVAAVLLATAIGLSVSEATAATRTWVGGNDPWDGDIFNWTGNDEPDADDDVVFNTNNHVEMGIDNEILSLDLSNSIALDSESFLLDVNGDITLAGDGTILRAGESDTVGLPSISVAAHNITVNSGATYANANFTSFLSPSGVGLFDVDVGGTLSGHGTIRNGDGVGAATVVFRNDGVIRPGTVTDGFIFVGTPAARTLTLASIDGDARIDLDGVTGDGALDIRHNQTLDIDIQVDDAFDGTIELAHNSTLDIEDAWTFSGTLTVENGFVPGQTMPIFIPEIPADVGYLTGGAVTMSGAATTIDVVDSDGTLQFDALFTANGGTINNSGKIVFNQDASINSSVDFRMTGVESGLTVGAGATVDIHDADMDFDGSGSSTNVITVEANGRLNLNLDSFEGNDRADGFLTLNSGDLSLTVTDGSWTMDRRLTLNNTGGGAPELLGSAVEIGDDAGFNGLPDADVRVEGSGSSLIRSAVTWNSDAEVDVSAGATLAVLGFSTFNTVNGAESAQFDGPGNIYFSGGQVNESTTLDFSGGTVGLDSGGAAVILLAAPDFTIDAPLTINAAAIDDYGRTVAFPTVQESELTINGGLGGRLNVNLDDPNDAWTVNNVGIVNLNGGALFFTALIDGSDLNMDGELNVDGLSRLDARVMIGGSGDVHFNDPVANLRLSGGDLASVNRLEGGTINGTGELSAADGKALHGHGSIAAAIDFDGTTSELMADDGTLTFTGTLLDVGVIGTADNDGVLDVSNPWNSNLAADVRLNGGTLQGAQIVNDGSDGINGWGLVTASVVNNTRIDAEGGTLELDNPATDWDGAANTGALNALSGNLVLRDNTNFAFQGTVRAQAGREVFADGFAVQFRPASQLELVGGTYRSTHDTDFEGSLMTSGGQSRVEVDGQFVFAAGSSTTLNSNLALANGETLIEVGATFNGGGQLANVAGHGVRLEDGADVDVLLRNLGTMAIGASPGQATGLDFVQEATGELQIELQGTGLTDYDRFDLTGQAQLDGGLDVSLIGGFMPTLGDSFTILSALVGVNGQFATLDLPALNAGLAWDVSYDPTLVNLMVIQMAGNPDFNQDGNLDCLDVDGLVAEIAAGTNGGVFDLTGDGQVTIDDLDSWLAQAGAAQLPSGNAYLYGDANLDGNVDGQDFVTWNGNKFTSGNGWCGADFNADGTTNGQDFVLWNSNKFTSADGISAVPEPASLMLLVLAFALGMARMCR